MAAAIKIGVSLSLSGKYALQGRQALAGLLAWAKAANAGGGVQLARLGRLPVEVVHYDDESSPPLAVKNVERLIASDGVNILLGPYSSELTQAVMPLVARYGRLLWNHGGASDAIHEERGGAIGVLTPASRYFLGFIALVRAMEPAVRTLAIFRRRGSGFGRQVAEGAQRAAQEAPLAVLNFTYSSARDALPKLVAKLRQQEVDLIVGAGAFEEDCLLAQELLAQQVRFKACALVAAAMGEFRRVLGNAAEGFFGPSQWEATLRRGVDFGPSPLAVWRRLGAMGAVADYPGAQAYAAGLIAQRCLEEGGSDEDRLWEAAARLDCTTFFGRFKIDAATGLQVGHEMVWVQWQRGRKVVVWPPALAQADPLYPMPAR